MYSIIINAGTTNVRICIAGKSGVVLHQYSEEAGVRCTAVDGNNHRLCNALKKGIAIVMKAVSATSEEIACCVAFGMIGSNVGLYEVPHLVAPVSLKALHTGIVTINFPNIAPFPISFIPGVRNCLDSMSVEHVGNMDMMRGEETEAVGLWKELHEEKPCMIVLPGSHNKFIAMDTDGTIRGCMTSISGELLDAITHHTILTSSLENDFVSVEKYDKKSMLCGAKECRKGLGHAAFTVRILRSEGNMTLNEARSYLLGAVLQTDLQALEAFWLYDRSQNIYVIGSAPLSTALIDLLVNAHYKICIVPDDLKDAIGIKGALEIYRGV